MYGNRFGGNRIAMFPPVIRWLIGINVAIFILGFVPAGRIDGEAITLQTRMLDYFALFPIGSGSFHPWQYFTYMFLHGGIAHIFFNLLVLWMFGLEIEQLWGSKRFLAFYVICGLGAGLLHSLVTSLLGGSHMGATIGASGAIMGVMIAFGMIFPDRIIFVSFFIPMKAKFAVIAFALLDLYMGVAGTDNVAHFAHLGGALVGFLLVKFGGKMTLGGIFDRIPWFQDKPTTGDLSAFQTRPRYETAPKIIEADFRDVKAPVSRSHTPINMNFGADQERIDAILDKISRTGYQNLSEEEKSILMEASKKIH